MHSKIYGAIKARKRIGRRKKSYSQSSHTQNLESLPPLSCDLEQSETSLEVSVDDLVSLGNRRRALALSLLSVAEGHGGLRRLSATSASWLSSPDSPVPPSSEANWPIACICSSAPCRPRSRLTSGRGSFRRESRIGCRWLTGQRDFKTLNLPVTGGTGPPISSDPSGVGTGAGPGAGAGDGDGEGTGAGAADEEGAGDGDADGDGSTGSGTSVTTGPAADEAADGEAEADGSGAELGPGAGAGEADGSGAGEGDGAGAGAGEPPDEPPL